MILELSYLLFFRRNEWLNNLICLFFFPSVVLTSNESSFALKSLRLLIHVTSLAVFRIKCFVCYVGFCYLICLELLVEFFSNSVEGGVILGHKHKFVYKYVFLKTYPQWRKYLVLSFFVGKRMLNLTSVIQKLLITVMLFPLTFSWSSFIQLWINSHEKLRFKYFRYSSQEVLE